ncbi:MAG: alanine--tRNA ligase [Zetaproteobacteria bacterium CG_4_9_14_3_um_filter_49_83]|nr:MAG: alanine--tRNA ligase [Zetaproteobacteria bacterium CG1_02_49_23]PIQ31103.1 MAG: alanine--tRNA ligase [Zetaproteobacteria bacterium CG17_big_fil_post_rev_8_21_14_2_50_50_13]PIY56833.1 MAG: alanine--tRNA ligase [Zetaproteobacteria bacterium CG_4_10_14_0_8_um_filter_49_80]PJA35749.1 MAG: alanine--tRNA ligase [Zetaproteobacteria bacterium CG_4_9_14_3_um_filter_49_83]
MNTSEIRKKFLDYFAGKGHEVLPSSSLVPHGDPTLMFTNAGMVQFKNVFLGLESRACSMASTSQKCVRAGGKHNDLENVGHTARHHTFFEMLGNFSFGDYFKEEAIQYAWEFLTVEMKLDASRLFVTVFEEDDEAYEIWTQKIGIPADKIARIGARDNFWSMGDTGPCGPCSEIFYDHGADIWGGPPGTPEEDGDRFVEIWNLVFMQYDRSADGELTPLPKPSVDTGMGLERMAAVMQGVHNNYDIDLFRQLIEAACDVTGVTFGANAETDVSLRVLADHLRSVSFLMADGVLPSNEGRGFVLRRILRRACRHGRLLGMKEAFIYKLVDALVCEMGVHFNELVHSQANIEQVIRIEEERFINTLDKGLKLVEQAVTDAGDGGTIPGKTLFTLYDTFGFPTDLTADILKGQNIQLDMDGFEVCMQEQRERARAAWGGSGETSVPRAVFELREEHGPTEFLGYTTVVAEGVVSGLLRDGEAVATLTAGEEGWLIANQTPFYAESGGQVGDTGVISVGDAVFEVHDSKKMLSDLFVHVGKVVQGTVTRGTTAHFQVEGPRRDTIRRNHTATHLLHAVLRQVLGEHVKQAGSLVNAERLRFDFSHHQPISAADKAGIEAKVNAAIWANDPVETKLMTQDEAVASGAMALFGEKYGDEVRVVSAGFSTELCGGTHVTRTGDIGPFRIMSETGIAAGVRRIEAATGPAAYQSFVSDIAALNQTANHLKVRPFEAEEAVTTLQARLKEAEKELQSLKAKAATGVLDDLIGTAQDVNGIKLLTAEVKGIADMRDFMDKAKGKLKSGVIVFGQVNGEKVQLVAGVTPDLIGSYHAGNIVREVAIICGGKGGGKPDMAMAGGTEPSRLKAALAAVSGLIQ